MYQFYSIRILFFSIYAVMQNSSIRIQIISIRIHCFSICTHIPRFSIHIQSISPFRVSNPFEKSFLLAIYQCQIPSLA